MISLSSYGSVQKIKTCLDRECYFEARKELVDFSRNENVDNYSLFVFMECLKSPCFLLRYEALSSLKLFAHEDFVRSAIIERLNDESWLMRQEALKILEDYTSLDERIFPLFIESLKDESPVIIDELLIFLEPYINKENKDIIIKNCLQNKYLLKRTIRILSKYASINYFEVVN